MRMMEIKIRGKRGRGRPKRRWMDFVETEMKQRIIDLTGDRREGTNK